MTFLYPWALALGALVVVPIVVHLLKRRIERRVPFPALRYLRSAERVHARSLRLRDLLLLLSRVAILLVIALAASGPLIGHGGTADHDPADVAIVIDNSASLARPVGDRTAFALLLDRARLSLRHAQPEDRFWVYPTVGPPIALGTGAGEALRELDRARLTDGAADLRRAIAEALQSLPPGRHRELQLLTDAQATNFSRPLGIPIEEVAIVMATGFEVETTNAAVAGLALAGGPRLAIGAHTDVVVSAQWNPGPDGPARSDSASLRLDIDGSTIGAAIAGWGDAAVFRLPALAAGAHLGKVEIEPSGLRADDSRHFGIAAGDPPAAEWSGPPESFLAAALATLRGGGRLGEGGAGRLGEDETVVHFYESWEGGPTDAPGGGDGTVVLIPPADDIALPRFNQLLSRSGIPWSLAPDPAAGDVGLERIASVPGLDEVQVRGRYLLTPGGGVQDSVVLRTTDGEPWAVSGPRGNGSYLLLASPLTPEASTLPTSPTMIPFIEILVSAWGQARGWSVQDVVAGESMTLPAASDSVRLPDGSVVRVDGGAPFMPETAGGYLLYRGDGPTNEAMAFAANVSPLESDLTPLTPARVSELLSGREVVMAGPDAGDWEAAIYRARRGRDGAPWLILALIILVGVEIILASPAPVKTHA